MTYLAREVINIIRISTDTYMQDCFSFHILVEYYIIYLTIQSSLDVEETVHKLMKMELKSGHEQELCHMVIDCCAQQRTYEKFYGLLAQRLCQLKKEYVEPFEKIFVDSYNTVHRLEIGKLRFNLYPFKRIRNNLVVNDIYQAIISRTGGIHWSQKIECAYT
ncbi:CWC22 [Lepeophtheirus salmonis]|uniref:CWC22 n=1 Tax=Lepeophtheirus salmonis TaxID=72036 RepID=A0A7R8CAZ4_LEPSM|nr:CWC22 [Lepeophtheirus salmonis]CAF2751479.1 CWC22 [Lepeophtheirus salmonis]